MNKDHFYKVVRKELFAGRISPQQFEGMEAILSAIDGSYTTEQKAYMLATIYHETARTMQPIGEIGKGRGYAYGKWMTNTAGVKYCFKSGHRDEVYTQEECDNLFYGRGYVQLTWFANYKKASNYLFSEVVLPDGSFNTDPNIFLKQPDLVMVPHIAARILCIGMRDGWFTGKKLSDYINIHKKDYVNARRIINGIDKARAIANVALIFESALKP